MDYTAKEDIIEHIFEKSKQFIVPSEANSYKSRFLQSNMLLYFVVLLLVLKVGVILITLNFPQNIFFADITKIALENFANQTRQTLGLPALKDNQKLDEAARLKAENMVQNQYFNHTSPSGVTPWYWFLKAGYSYKYAGENLAVGFYDSEEVYNAWLNSPSHKANIVNPKYTEVGTAVLGGFGQNNAIIVVQEFGAQLPKAAAAKNSNAKTATTQPAVKNTEPVPAENTQTSINKINEKVLSQATESQISIEAQKDNAVTDLPSKILNFVLYSNDTILQNIIYGISTIVMGILLTLIFLNSNINFKKELVFRSVLIIALLSAAALLNNQIITSIIPHQIII